MFLEGRIRLDGQLGTQRLGCARSDAARATRRRLSRQRAGGALLGDPLRDRRTPNLKLLGGLSARQTTLHRANNPFAQIQ